MLYAGGDMHGGRMVWYLVDWLLVLSILQAAHSPALAPYYEAAKLVGPDTARRGRPEPDRAGPVRLAERSRSGLSGDDSEA